MSLYTSETICNPSTSCILALLGFEKDVFERYRDVYIRNGYIVVHTRCGGRSRIHYAGVFDSASKHPWWSHDRDCECDSTYANIYFKIPTGEVQTLVALLDQGIAPVDRWVALSKGLV